MSFLETPRFPDRISQNMEVSISWSTRVVLLASGYEQRNIEWSAARARYNIGTAIKSADELKEIIAWIRATQGRGHGFRIKDPTDYQTTAADDDGYIGTGGVGDGTPTGQLYKVYVTGALSEARLISKPVSGQVVFYLDGNLITPTLDTTTGIATFTVLDSASVVNATPASGNATTVELSDALAGAQVGDKVYLSGLLGTIGNTLNGSAHTIQGISGSPNSILDLAVDTSGLSYTSGGTASFYPQARHSLRWVGEFDVPVRFDSDALRMLVKTTKFQRMSDIPIVEIRV